MLHIHNKRNVFLRLGDTSWSDLGHCARFLLYGLSLSSGQSIATPVTP